MTMFMKKLFFVSLIVVFSFTAFVSSGASAKSNVAPSTQEVVVQEVVSEGEECGLDNAGKENMQHVAWSCLHAG